MNFLTIGRTSMQVSGIAYGCMEIGGSWSTEPLSSSDRQAGLAAVHAALDQGINFFDHADIYSRGKSEEVFSGLWQESPGLRDKIYLQSKCGIVFGSDTDESLPHRFDFSYEHIIHSVEGILSRLKTDYLDLLLLHRPDPLIEPEEVAHAFDDLQRTGKVRYFGVSNHTAAQIELLQSYLDQPIVVNQMEISLLHFQLIEAGIIANQERPDRPVRNEATLEYCRLNDITLQAWSPLARGQVSGRENGASEERIRKTAALVADLARQKGVSREAILIAGLLRHPAQIQPVIGTTNPQRIAAACQGDQVELSREEWYRLFIAARGEDIP